MIGMIGGDGYGKLTQIAGTRIQLLVGGKGGLFTHLLNVRYTDTGTAHTITPMVGASRGKVATSLAAAGTALICDRALTDTGGNAPANLDSIAVRLDNGAWHLSTISAWDSTTFTLTLNTAIPTNRTAARGATIVLFGVAADQTTKQLIAGSASGAVNFPALAGQDVSLCRGAAPGDPILLDSDNATNAGTLNIANVGYAKR